MLLLAPILFVQITRSLLPHLHTSIAAPAKGGLRWDVLQSRSYFKARMLTEKLGTMVRHT